LPAGFQIFDSMTAEEWKKLCRDYLNNRHLEEWLDDVLYEKIRKMLRDDSYYAESMPPLGSSEAKNKEFIRCWDKYCN
jgi:hypothetical protein